MKQVSLKNVCEIHEELKYVAFGFEESFGLG